MTFSKNILTRAFAVAIILIVSVKSYAQSVSDAVYYVCAEKGFRLKGPIGFDHYAWSEDNVGMPGADSNTIVVQALGAATVGNSYVTRTFHLKVMNNNSCWSDQGTYVVYVLPKMELSITGYTPPYCEHLSHDITLTAKINGGAGTTALTLPPGMGVTYNWTVDQVNILGGGSLGNAGILGPTDQAQAQVMTPQDATIDNNYNVEVQYSYPPTVNSLSDVVGSCSDNLTQNVHADPAPPVPTINYESI